MKQVLNKRKTLLIIPRTLALSVPIVLLKKQLFTEFTLYVSHQKGKQELSGTAVRERNKMLKINTASHLKWPMSAKLAAIKLYNHFITNNPVCSTKASFSFSPIFIIIQNKMLVQLFVQENAE